jgi:hypothetical protein
MRQVELGELARECHELHLETVNLLPILPPVRNHVSCEHTELIIAEAIKRKLPATGFVPTDSRYRLFLPRPFPAQDTREDWLRGNPLSAHYLAYVTKGWG